MPINDAMLHFLAMPFLKYRGRDARNFVDALQEYGGHPRDLWNFVGWRRALERHLRGSDPTLGKNYVKRQRFDARMKRVSSKMYVVRVLIAHQSICMLVGNGISP